MLKTIHSSRFFNNVQTHYRPLRLNVGFLLSQTAGYGREFDFREERLTLGGDIHLNAFTGHLLLNRTPQGVIAQGDFTAAVPAECARCLKDFVTSVPVRLEELFVYPPQNATDALLAIGEDAHLDLEPVLRDFLVVNQPTRPLCRPDCKGLCPVCGNDLNEVECSHPDEEDRSGRLAQGILLQAAGLADAPPPAINRPVGAGRHQTVKSAAAGKKSSAGKGVSSKKPASGRKSGLKTAKTGLKKGKKTSGKTGRKT
jgi:uncharacterized protein